MSNEQNKESGPDGELRGIDELEKKLSRSRSTYRSDRPGKLKGEIRSAKRSWSDQAEPDSTSEEETGSSFFSTGLFLKFLIGALVVFILTLTVAGFVLWWGSNVVSNRNIDITFQGPETVTAGTRTSFQVAISNRNQQSLEEAELLIKYPSGTYNPDNPGEVLEERVYPLRSVRPGETVGQRVEAVFMGQPEEVKEFQVVLRYEVPGSTTSFGKNQSERVVIGSPALSINVSADENVIDGQTAEIDLELVSNASMVLPGLILKLDPPAGFTVADSEPQPVVDDPGLIWSIGDLEPGETKTIKLVGDISGAPGEVKVFSFQAGPGLPGRVPGLASVWGDSLVSIEVEDTLLSGYLLVNGRRPEDISVRSDSRVRMDVGWQNNLPISLRDGIITLKFIDNDGVLDTGSVSAERGFFSSSDQEAKWDRSTLENLRDISPGQQGSNTVFFDLDSLVGRSSPPVNPVLDLLLTVEAKRTDERYEEARVYSETSRRVKIDTDIQLAAKVAHSVGPFDNQGPIPPRANEATDYTVTWSVINTSNKVAEGEVRAVLPPYVSWNEKIDPEEGEYVFYDPDSREVVWDLEEVEPGVGFDRRSREVSFQLSMTPSEGQVGRTVDIIGDMVLTGRDTFTTKELKFERRALDSRLTGDPGAEFVSGVVVEPRESDDGSDDEEEEED